jgi:tetratricopeptide (TPR) repeat protein
VEVRGAHADSRGLPSPALLAFALHLLVDFDLKMPALAMIVATMAALVTAEGWPEGGLAPARSRPVRAAALGVAVAALGFALLWAVPKYRADEIRRAARERIDRMAKSGVDVAGERGALAEIRSGLDRATALDPSNAQAWSDRAYADSLWALANPPQTKELGAEVGRDAERALSLCSVIGEFWIRRGTGYDMERRWIEGGRCFVRALELAPNRADAWYYQAYHLSLASTERGPAMAAADFCLRLDPSFLLAQSLRQRLAIQPQPHP